MYTIIGVMLIESRGFKSKFETGFKLRYLGVAARVEGGCVKVIETVDLASA